MTNFEFIFVYNYLQSLQQMVTLIKLQQIKCKSCFQLFIGNTVYQYKIVLFLFNMGSFWGMQYVVYLVLLVSKYRCNINILFFTIQFFNIYNIFGIHWELFSMIEDNYLFAFKYYILSIICMCYLCKHYGNSVESFMQYYVNLGQHIILHNPKFPLSIMSCLGRKFAFMFQNQINITLLHIVFCFHTSQFLNYYFLIFKIKGVFCCQATQCFHFFYVFSQCI
eukprot:TRINITY_DN980_c0_g1_i2.p2 TRINITY_DN980_c0_g1~~TRINITY_DN980_c0_g1_i2.p2  ORF type:complete len:222 (-),score=-24.02 TRINITY_DN980_c0_g1_i2:413-1078(-)